MDIDIEAFPLDRFLGPVQVKACLAARADERTADEIRKGLLLLATAYGLTFTVAAEDRALVFSGPGPCPTPGAHLRRCLTCWLLSLEVVVLLSIRRLPDAGSGFRVLLEVVGG